jgi:hypothetical protein
MEETDTQETAATFSIECVGFCRDLSETVSTSKRPSLPFLNRMCSQHTRDGTAGRHRMVSSCTVQNVFSTYTDQPVGTIRGNGATQL